MTTIRTPFQQSTPWEWCAYTIPGLGYCFGFLFLCYATVSLLWTSSVHEGVEGIWHLVMLLMGFVLGSILRNLKLAFVGLALWLTVSVVSPYNQFLNPNMFGACLVLGLVGAIGYRQWWFIPVGLVGLAQSQFRGGIIALAICGLVWVWQRWRRDAVLLCIGLVILLPLLISLKGYSSLDARFVIWQDVFKALTFFGYGIGSFFDTYPSVIQQANITQWRPDHVYNDYLELLFEYGIGIIPLCLLVALAIRNSDERDRMVLIAFLGMSLSYFVFYYPVTGFVGALVVGHCCRKEALR